jgi:hypothetical protein
MRKRADKQQAICFFANLIMVTSPEVKTVSLVDWDCRGENEDARCPPGFL